MNMTWLPKYNLWSVHKRTQWSLRHEIMFSRYFLLCFILLHTLSGKKIYRENVSVKYNGKRWQFCFSSNVKRFASFFFQAEDGIRGAQESRGLGDVYKRQFINITQHPWYDEIISELRRAFIMQNLSVTSRTINVSGIIIRFCTILCCEKCRIFILLDDQNLFLRF